MRDQLDRFGEIDHTTNLLQRVADATTDTVVLNREDKRVAGIAESLNDKKVRFYGLDASLLPLFPSDDNLHGNSTNQKSDRAADVILLKFSDSSATFIIDGRSISTKLKITGVYNVFNAAAAISLVRAILSDKIDQSKLIVALSKVTPAFGRGEMIKVNGQPLELVLVKNPSGFRLGLKSFDSAGYATMIAINDNYADGRDMSWLWDVDFTSLATDGVEQISGVRAYDMALRLRYDEVPVKYVDTNLKTALDSFITKFSDRPMRVYCTYTAMLTIRKSLSKIAKVEVVK
jgi:UDP-N-acetylmuramyl tripeptide synthase